MDSKMIIQVLGRALHEARTRRGLSQAALAALAGLPRLKVIQAERGDASVSMGAYARLAAALGQQFALAPARRPTLEEVAGLLADE